MSDDVTTADWIDPAELRRVRWAGGIGVAVMAVYWVLWFTARSSVASDTTRAYEDFENAFPLADAWIAWCIVAGLWCLARRRSAALAWLLLASGAGSYLFAMDVLYDVEHGIYAKGAGGAIEAIINVVTLGLSVWFGRWAWRHRSTLLGAARVATTT